MIALITAAIAPGLALLSYFYLRNHYSGTTIGFILKTFFVGALLVFPVMVLQYAFLAEGYFIQPLLRTFILYGFVEEFFKWFLLYIFTYQHATFTKRYDGIVFAVSLSLGFATLENVFYLLANGLDAALGRAIFPVSSHALYGVIMGYYFGRSKLEKTGKYKNLLLALLFPVLLHGTYDYIIILFEMYFLFGTIPFMLLLWWIAITKMKRAHQLDI
ncbi:glutamic-type intramembrane protease PrsW [Bacillus sp. JCM 19034]|uniref:glutamic-type intramembrane protease PrsW n=1 Tax=Bacillus sp. JCM 19034 TaxID=1481928 RepID=UPI000783234C|nr:glutamic-type intramembrane protease PrsW [Bacillus sp. JCM 19034]